MKQAAQPLDPSPIRLNRNTLLRLHTDTHKTAAAVHLVYITDKEPGIARIKKGDSFTYIKDGKALKTAEDINRIKALVIPPAWENVWISPIANSHLQVTGYDARGRKQYRYHQLWSSVRNQTKFFHMHAFGQALPAIRRQLEKDLNLNGLPQEKVLAAVISIMQCTCIRIGNDAYEKLYGSFGLTTLKDQHVKVTGGSVQFSFKGKKGVYHKVDMKSRKLARIVQQCRDIPGKELFQYYTEEGTRKAIDSGMVNAYIRQISNGDFTAKDFRTWAGSLKALEVLKEIEKPASETQAKKKIVEVLDIVAGHLGNTRTVCKKYYVHPILFDHFTNHTLHKFISNPSLTCDTLQGLTEEEQLLMTILESNKSTIIT